MPENNEFMARLKEFRDTHKQKTLIKDSMEWKYYSSGKGEEAILMLVGGLGVGEAAFLHIMELEKSYRVIVPSFPPVSTISELVRGIIEILDREAIESFSIIGQSLGGMLAQELLRRCKARVRKVVFSHTTTITPSNDRKQLREEKEKLQKLIKVVKIMPLGLMKKMLKQRLHKHFNMNSKQESEFWKSYFDEIVDSKSKAEEIASYSSIVDFIDKYLYAEDDFSDWTGKVLIMDSDTDGAFDMAQKSAIKALFPQANIYTFKNTGHLSIIVARKEFMKQLKDFLKD